MTMKFAAALLFAAFVAGPALAEGADAKDRRSVTVTGSGEVFAAPDRARLSMNAESTRPAIKDAQAEVNRIVRDYIAAARALGAKDEDISTAGLSVHAQYDYTQNNGRKFRGYQVTRGIAVVVRDLDKLGDLLLRATDTGINDVSDPALESSKSDELQREALGKAAADAQAKAQVLADALGLKLGAAHTVNAAAENDVQPMPKRMMMAAAPAPESGNAEMGFSAGEIRYAATLTADFDLEPR